MWWSPFCFGPFSRVLSKKFIYRFDFSWRLETSDFSCIVFQHSPHVWRTHFAEYLYFPDQALSEILPWFYVSCSTLSYSNTTSLQVFLEFVSKNWLSSQALNNWLSVLLTKLLSIKKISHKRLQFKSTWRLNCC